MTEPNDPQEQYPQDTQEQYPQEFGELVEIQLAPCTIYTKLGAFLVEDVGAWYYTAAGVVATGRWNNESREEGTVFIPFTQVVYVQYDYDALARWQEHNEGSSD